MSFDSYRHRLKSKSDADIVALILALSEGVLDMEVSRQAAPRLKDKWRACVSERRNRRIKAGKQAAERKAA